MTRFLLLFIVAGAIALAPVGLAHAQAPVTGAADAEALFTSPDPKLHRNKQAAYHIQRDLLEAGHWELADQWLTERYIQHNPGFASGRDTVMKAFGARGAGRPIPADPKEWSTKIVAVTTQGNDIVCVASVSTRPDPRNPGQTYTTTHFDMWKFIDGKADEHWDEGQITAPAAGGRGAGGPGGPGGPPPGGARQ